MMWKLFNGFSICVVDCIERFYGLVWMGFFCCIIEWVVEFVKYEGWME